MNILSRFRPYPEMKAGIVNLKSGSSFRGLVWRVGAYTVLRNVEMLQDRGQAARHVVDGEVIVMTSDIDFIQVM